MPSYAIINVANVATPVSYTYSGNTVGTGTITTFTGNTTVIGVGTTFLTQLGTYYAVRNAANTFVGKIANITSNTSATLSKNAVTAIANAAYTFQTFNYSVLQTDPHVGNGNISTFSTNSTVIGTNTTFINDLNIGYHLFDSTDGNLIGMVKSITSNTVATLTSVSGYPGSNLAYRVYDPITKNTQAANLFNVNAHHVNAALLNWSKSGLIQGVRQIKSYHPPMPDPVTGVLVNFPATTHEIEQLGNIVLHNYANNSVYNLSNFSSVNTSGVVKDFNEDNGIVGSSTSKAVKSIPINGVVGRLIKSGAQNINVAAVVNSIYGTPVPPNGPGSGYTFIFDTPPSGFTKLKSYSAINALYDAWQGPGANVVYVMNANVTSTSLNTASDMFAFQAGAPPPERVIDTFTDAQQYFSTADSKQTLSDAEKADLAARASNRFTPNGPKGMVSTGVPAAIPGSLNIILTDQDPANRPYITPKYRRTLPSTVTTYNTDIPFSVLNPPPPEL